VLATSTFVYAAHRAPFGIHLHADWFLDNPEYFEAFLRFVDTLLADFDDVYFVSGHQVLEWMRQPQTIDEARQFEPWKRSCNATAGALNDDIEPASTAQINGQIQVSDVESHVARGNILAGPLWGENL